ncbi:hypothetical protein HanIR_Chr02g0091051 [Helianthus annuus]|nr:hypothetical protein HanIR_Chr02g0091051 [Helianthus annuus]
MKPVTNNPPPDTEACQCFNYHHHRRHLLPIPATGRRFFIDFLGNHTVIIKLN